MDINPLSSSSSNFQSVDGLKNVLTIPGITGPKEEMVAAVTGTAIIQDRVYLILKNPTDSNPDKVYLLEVPTSVDAQAYTGLTVRVKYSENNIQEDFETVTYGTLAQIKLLS